MKKLVFVCLFITYSFIIKSQDFKIILIDSLSGKPISYATVCFLEEKSGTYTNENGIFYPTKLGQQMQISHIGYYPRKLNLLVRKDTIKLQPLTYILKEITIKPNEKNAEEIGYYDSKSYFTFTGFSGDELAVY